MKVSSLIEAILFSEAWNILACGVIFCLYKGISSLGKQELVKLILKDNLALSFLNFMFGPAAFMVLRFIIGTYIFLEAYFLAIFCSIVISDKPCKWYLRE